MKVWKGIALFAGGTVFGLWGIKMLCSKDAKKAYTHCTAGVLRAKDYVMDQVTSVKENCADIYEEAKAINEERAKKEKENEFDDEAEVFDDMEDEAEEVKEEKKPAKAASKAKTTKTATKTAAKTETKATAKTSSKAKETTAAKPKRTTKKKED